jgi:RNA polymerase sigma-70 factor (ECF subfamily)
MNDEEILDLYWSREEDAIRQTQQRYGEKLFALALRIVDNREDAQECVNDTYLKAWNAIPPQRPTFFFAYLSKICRNQAFGKLDWKNAAKRKAEIVELTEQMQQCIPDTRAEISLEGETLGAVLNGFLESLPRESRQIFMRRYYFLDSIEEIADRYGITQSKVKTRLHRTRTKLYDYLQQEGIKV